MHYCLIGLQQLRSPPCHISNTQCFFGTICGAGADYFANPSIEGMPKRLRLLVTPHVKR
jgi:hypothetical protein